MSRDIPGDPALTPNARGPSSPPGWGTGFLIPQLRTSWAASKTQYSQINKLSIYKFRFSFGDDLQGLSPSVKS